MKPSKLLLLAAVAAILVALAFWSNQQTRATPPAAVVIEDDVWLGLNVVVLKGVTIGRGSVIGANSLVTRSIPAGVVAAGSPAKVIRTLDAAGGLDKDTGTIP